jgi:hypothetical protein
MEAVQTYDPAVQFVVFKAAADTEAMTSTDI